VRIHYKRAWRREYKKCALIKVRWFNNSKGAKNLQQSAAKFDIMYYRVDAQIIFKTSSYIVLSVPRYPYINLYYENNSMLVVTSCFNGSKPMCENKNKIEENRSTIITVGLTLFLSYLWRVRVYPCLYG
jgi:hypothetical protein